MFLCFFKTFGQMTNYISGLNNPTKIIADGTILYANGWQHIYQINTQDTNPAATTIYTAPLDHYIYQTLKVNNELFILMEHYINDTDTFIGSEIRKIDLTNLSNPDVTVLISNNHFIATFAYKNNEIFYLDEIETVPNNPITSLKKINSTITNPTPVVVATNLFQGVAKDMEIHNNTIYVSESDNDAIYTLNLNDNSINTFETNVTFNRGTFLALNDDLYITDGNEILKKNITNTNANLISLGQNNIYQDSNNGTPYYANFRDITVIGNTMYLTLENQGLIVTIEDSTLSTNDIEVSNDIKTYPNPTPSILTIDTNNNIEIESIKLYNIQGRLIGTYQNANTLDISNLESGLYLLNITSNRGSVTKQIIKQ